MAEMLMGISLMSSVRFSAVTTISCSCSPASAARAWAMKRSDALQKLNKATESSVGAHILFIPRSPDLPLLRRSAPRSEVSRQVKHRSLDLVEAIRPRSRRIARQHVVACDVLRIAIIEIEVDLRQPAWKEVAPFETDAAIHRIGGRLQVVAIDPDERAGGDCVAEAVTPVDQAYTGEVVARHLVGLQAHTEIVRGGHRAARSHSQMRARAGGGLGLGQRRLQIDPDFALRDAQIDENLRAWLRRSAGVVVFVDVAGIARAPIAAVADEGREAQKGAAIDIPPIHDVTTQGCSLPGVGVGDLETGVVVVGERARIVGAVDSGHAARVIVLIHERAHALLEVAAEGRRSEE